MTDVELTNAIAGIVMKHNGYTPLSIRYGIADEVSALLTDWNALDDDDDYEYTLDDYCADRALLNDDFDWDEDPFPPPSPLDTHPRFIVVRDDDEDELTGFSVRGRGQDQTYAEGEYPIYNEPLLRGDALWCELAATALNERG